MIFKKILLFAIFATAAGFCFADGNPPVAGNIPQVTIMPPTACAGPNCGTPPANVQLQMPPVMQPMPGPGQAPGDLGMVATPVGCDAPPEVQNAVPVWPAIGSDADIQIANTASGSASVGNIRRNDDNIKIVSKIGADLTVENNINLGGDRHVFSGGANMLHPYQAPAGFNIFANESEMPLMHQEMLEDDGGAVLAMSRSTRAPGGMRGLGGFIGAGGSGGEIRSVIGADGRTVSLSCDATGACVPAPANVSGDDSDYQIYDDNAPQMGVNNDGIEAPVPPAGVQDQVRSWVVASGQTLRSVLQDWSNKEGWDLIWGTAREYPIEASAVFKGRFVDVSSALVRNFSRATPIPYAKFYKGNRVLVVTTVDGN
ncbi:MAG: toxin co-regulated pilus biosynthesis Q family protein [Proteobacteria bacterium]|nr:toxin co-regulated pilus biosynthesis Q family protein [Pseudomonadota bacterium]